MNTPPTVRKCADGFEVEVCHPNGERKWLVIESWHERWIAVRWPLAGIYEIMLKTGELIARSPTTRKRNPINPWRAVDKLECRDFVAERMGISKTENNERYRNHHESMPHRKCTLDDIKREYEEAINDVRPGRSGT